MDNGCRVQMVERIRISCLNLGENRIGELGSTERFLSNMRLLEQLYMSETIDVDIEIKIEVNVQQEKVSREFMLLRIKTKVFKIIFIYYVINKKYFQKDQQPCDLFFTNSNYKAVKSDDFTYAAPTMATIFFQCCKKFFF